MDATKVGILGICGGGGYTIKAVQTDKRFKAVATLSMFNSGIVRRNGFFDEPTSTIQERLAQASKARQQEADGGEVLYTPDMCDMPEEEARTLPADLYRMAITIMVSIIAIRRAPSDTPSVVSLIL